MIVKSASCFLLTPLCRALWFCPETAGREAQPPMPMSEGSLTANSSTQACTTNMGDGLYFFILRVCMLAQLAESSALNELMDYYSPLQWGIVCSCLGGGS